MFARLLTVLAMLTLVGCQSVRDTEAPALSWSLAAVRPLNVSVTDQQLAVVIDLRNDGPGDARLAGLEVRLRIGDQPAIDGRIGGFIDVPAGAVRTVRFRRVTTLADLADLLHARAADRPYRLTGFAVHAHIPGRWPLADEGRMSEVDLRPARKARPGL